jgi:hypothetical protein
LQGPQVLPVKEASFYIADSFILDSARQFAGNVLGERGPLACILAPDRLADLLKLHRMPSFEFNRDLVWGKERSSEVMGW